ncbi:MAG: hypothetical protein RMK74_02900, partial [Myxococcales bacterium]|nr:hypothetical protein [Myxococcales bacterium]
MRARRHTACAATGLGLLAGCVMHAPDARPVEGPASIRVHVPPEARGSPAAPLPVSVEPTVVPVQLEVLGVDGSPRADFDGWLELRIEPGDVVRTQMSGGERTFGPHVPVRGGRAQDVLVHVARAFGTARIWAEDVGYIPADPATAACANGLDDDGDGRVDAPLDPGCRYGNDGDEREGSHAAGVSEPLHFAPPAIADVQGRTGSSPLEGRRVTVERGEMIVTRITTDGFFVSDVALDGSGLPTGEAVPWGSIFVFNFNTPPRLRVCDRIETLSGAVVEFFGFTELTFPSWRSEDWCRDPGPCTLPSGRTISGRRCPVPEPVVLDGTLLGTPMLEAFEAGLVRVLDAQLPERMGPRRPARRPDGAFELLPDATNCDLDNNGDVSLARGDPERACNEACAADPGCAEWNQFLEFGQFAVRSSGRVILVVTREAVPDFDPVRRRGERLAAITGTLRHFAPLGAERGWIVEPRCEADLAATVADVRAPGGAGGEPPTGGPR